MWVIESFAFQRQSIGLVIDFDVYTGKYYPVIISQWLLESPRGLLSDQQHARVSRSVVEERRWKLFGFCLANWIWRSASPRSNSGNGKCTCRKRCGSPGTEICSATKRRRKIRTRSRWVNIIERSKDDLVLFSVRWSRRIRTLLVTTIIVSLVHTVFEFLAF